MLKESQLLELAKSGDYFIIMLLLLLLLSCLGVTQYVNASS